MKKLTITILHILPNRVRLKLSAPIKDTKTFYSNIKNNLKYFLPYLLVIILIHIYLLTFLKQ